MNKKNDFFFIGQFAIDDFKIKYAGSIFGFLWAFIQPIITVIIYWFVFQIAFQNQPVDGTPFIVWLVSGIVPWFFVSDAIINATSSLIDYNYLVKKVLFNIEILPLARVISVLFIQIILLVFSIILLLFYNCKLQLSILQIVYYLIYSFIFCLGISYFTSALYVFFKDVIQFVSVILQLLFWMTPIVWRLDFVPVNIQNILRYNPVYYIVNGYRDSLIQGKFFYEYKLQDNIYYWIVACLILFIGKYVFKKLKVHFADVL